MITIPRKNLVAEYYLNWNAYDSSWNWYNWTATNVAWVDSNIWYQNRCASFDGSSSYIDLWTKPVDQNFTCSVWFKYNTTPSSMQFLVDMDYQWSSTLSNRNWFCICNYIWTDIGWSWNWKIWILLVDSNYNYNILETNSEILDTNWHHIVVTYYWTELKLYLDSVLQWTKTTWWWVIRTWWYSNNTYYLWVMWNISNIEYYFNWQQKLVRFYNNKLSDSEIQTLYLEGLQKLTPSRVSYPSLFDWCVAYYDFRNGDLSNLVDWSLATNNWATLTIDHLGYGNNAYSMSWGTNIKISPYPYELWWKDNFSIAIIFKPNDVSILQQMLWIYRDSTSAWITIPIYYSDLKFVKYTWWTSATLQVAAWLTAWQWYFAVYIYDWSNMKIYIDWNLVWTLATTWLIDTMSSWRWAIWDNNWILDQAFNWVVSYLKVFNRALSDYEIKLLHKLLML